MNCKAMQHDGYAANMPDKYAKDWSYAFLELTGECVGRTYDLPFQTFHLQSVSVCSFLGRHDGDGFLFRRRMMMMMICLGNYFNISAIASRGLWKGRKCECSLFQARREVQRESDLGFYSTHLLLWTVKKTVAGECGGDVSIL
ncbi:hypothetical protein GQ457_03G044250 [Hibiscus cannabinus]